MEIRKLERQNYILHTEHIGEAEKKIFQVKMTIALTYNSFIFHRATATQIIHT